MLGSIFKLIFKSSCTQTRCFLNKSNILRGSIFKINIQIVLYWIEIFFYIKVIFCVAQSSKLIFKPSCTQSIFYHMKVIFCVAQSLKINIHRFKIVDLENSLPILLLFSAAQRLRENILWILIFRSMRNQTVLCP